MKKAKLFDNGHWQECINAFSRRKIPFFFFINFDKSQAFVSSLNDMPDDVLFSLPLIKNHPDFSSKNVHENLINKISTVDYDTYKRGFDHVYSKLQNGDTFLINLTFPSSIELNCTLDHIFYNAQAKYKLLWKDKCVVFSPECFIKIQNDKIYSYPMKGTINAALDQALNKLLNDEKEIAEHYTIVDLLRNDLSMVAHQVHVEKYRYVDEIISNRGNLLHTSSVIKGQIDPHYLLNLGDLFDRLLPAGSVSGAPKKKTLEIIKEAEIDDRGFYTGVFGVFDGTNLDSGVAIRFIEKNNSEYLYRSGGGITHMSKAKDEFEELINKIYVPTH